MNEQGATCALGPVTIRDDWDSAPSITKQGFNAGFFNFGKTESKGVDYFNCGFVQRPDGLWLVTRRSKHRPNLKIGFNDIVAFKLDGNLTPCLCYPVGHERRFFDEHFEDPRAVYHDGFTYVSSCNFMIVGGRWTGAHQIVARCAMTWAGAKRFDPIYGHNIENIGTSTGHEKNWLWFFHGGKPHLIYQAVPHTVVAFNDGFEKQSEFVTNSLPIAWEWGEIRGGTPPVLVGGEYWTFFHSSVKTGNKYTRRYFMGAYSFESKPPFAITSCTSEPLLIGSKDDPWHLGKPLVVFPCGSIFKDGYWTVSLGVNDLKCAWVEIPHAKLLKLAGKKTGY